MRIAFRTLKGQDVRVESNTIHLVNEGNAYAEENKDMEAEPFYSQFKVIVGDEYFIYPISGDEWCRLARDFDSGGI